MINGDYLQIIENIFTDEGDHSREKRIAQFCYDTIDNIIFALDIRGKIIILNKQARAELGYREEEISGSNFIENLIRKDDRAEIKSLFDEIVNDKTNPVSKFKLRLITGTDKIKSVESKYQLIRDKQAKPLGIILRGINKCNDKSDSFNMNAERNHSKGKEDHKYENQGYRPGNELIKGISHEIRTPLSAIMGFTEQLMHTDLDKSQEEYLRIIDKSSEYLNNLINKQLVHTKTEIREISFNEIPFNISNTVNYIFRSLKEKVKGKNISLTYHIDDELNNTIIGDSFRLRQVLLNMLGNAIKYTDSGHVKLKCLSEENAKDHYRVKFEVSDTGTGISPGKLKNIFSEDSKNEHITTREYRGTGLGLMNCKNIIELQNGSLYVSSTENAGTTFSFIIPYKKAALNKFISGDTEIIDPLKLKDIKILIVEDDSVNRLLVKTILKKLQCSFDTVINGREAIGKIDSNNYDLILLDINLPDISGLDVADYMKNIKKDKQTKIIAFSAVITSRDINEYYSTGIDDFLLKPYKEINLYNKICNVLENENEDYENYKTKINLREEDMQPFYDLSDLKAMIGDNNEAVKKVLEDFIGNSEIAIETFNTGLRDEKHDKIGEAAHKILPAYRHLKVNSVIRLLEDINHKYRTNPEGSIHPDLISNTARSIREVVEAIKKELDADDAGPAVKK